MANNHHGEQDRNAPQNLEAERALLGSVLLDPTALDAVIECGVDQEDLYSEAHKLVYQCMVDLAERQRVIDVVTVSEELARDGLIEKAGGAGYLSQLTDGVPIGTTAAVSEYCRIVKDKSKLRKIIAAASNTMARAMEGTDPDELAESAEIEMSEIGGAEHESGFMSIREIVTKSFGQIDVLFDRGQRVTGIETGLEDLDNMTSGFQPSELIIVASRPSAGKTSLGLNVAVHASVKHRHPVGIFSLEMSKESLVMRMLCAEARIDSHKLRTGFSSREDWNRMTPALGRISDAPLYIDDTPSLSIQRLRSKARRLKQRYGIKLLVVDYFQLVTGRGENRTQELGQVSRGLKAMAKELKVPVVALAQLSRDVEKRTSERPQLSDIRECGSAEADADVVIFIFQPKDARKEEEQAQAEGENGSASSKALLIGKARSGPTGIVPVVFVRAFCKFENQARDSYMDYVAAPEQQ